MPANQNWVPLIQQYARRFNVDPQAALAVARMEGLGGGIGDGGHAFGPFQLNDAGGVLTGRSGNHRAFAESPAGIMWAMQHIGQVAAGLHGQQAVNAIVRRFERPANPNAEVAGALRAYGRQPAPAGVGGLAQQAAAPQAVVPQGPDPNVLKQKLAQLLIGAAQTQGPQDFSPILSMIQQRNQALAQPRPVAAAPVLQPRPVATGASSQQNTPGAAPNGKPSLGFLLPFATKYGLTVTSTTGGKHAVHSYHYQSRAVDYGGNAQRMARLYAYALAHPRLWQEAFYAGPGAAPYFVKGGKVYPISQLDPALRREHVDHVHLAR